MIIQITLTMGVDTGYNADIAPSEVSSCALVVCPA